MQSISFHNIEKNVMFQGDVFDAVVVVMCFTLDAVYLHSHDAHIGTGFLIVLRLWRVVHIQRGEPYVHYKRTLLI